MSGPLHGHSELELLDRAGLAPHVASARYVGGLLDPLGGHLHPLNLVQGEAAAVESLGGRIFENSRVVEVETGANPVVRTAQGEVQASYVLVCGNAYIGDLLPELGGKIMPVSTQVLATEPLGELAETLAALQCLRRGLQLRAGLFPAQRGSADPVWRRHRLWRTGPGQHPPKNPAADAQNLSAR